MNGSHRHAMADSYSYEALRLCHEIFSSKDMMSDENREKLMVASYHGGASLANSFVGVVHPFSAGLSIVFGTLIALLIVLLCLQWKNFIQ